MAFQGVAVPLIFGVEGLTGNQNQRQLRPTQLIEAVNIDLSDRTIRREHGALRYTPDPVANGALILAGADWWPEQTLQRQICYFDDGTIRRDDGNGTFAITLISGLATAVNPQFLSGGRELPGNPRKLFMFNGIDPPLELVGDGVIMTAITGPVDWTGINQPIFGRIHLNRLWAGGIASAPHRVYFSDPDDHSMFVGVEAGSIDVFQGQAEGRRLLAAASLSGLLILLKSPRGVYVLDTRSPQITDWAFTMAQMTTDYGIASATAITQINGSYIFVTPEFNVISIDPSDKFGHIELTSLSQGLQMDEVTKGLINRQLLMRSQGVFYPAKRQIWFTAAPKQSPEMNHRIIFDFHIPDLPRIWLSARDINESLWMFEDSEGVDRPMIGDGSGNVFLLDEDGTFAKDGLTAESRFQTPHMDFSFLNPTYAYRRKTGRALHLLYEGPIATQTFVDVFWDGEIHETLTFDPFGLQTAQLGPPVAGGTIVILDATHLARSTVGILQERLTGSGIRLSLKIRSSLQNFDFSLAGAVIFLGIDDERIQPTTL